MVLKTSGLLCRASHDCDAAFHSKDPSSVKSLLEAAAQRDAHELEVHGYRHRVTEVGRPDFAAGPRARARRKRDLDPVI